MREITIRRPAVRRLLAATADLLLPQRCLVCRRFGAALHVHCIAALPAAEEPRCGRCWRPGRTPCEVCASDGPDVPRFEALRTPYRFEGDVRRAILEAKFRGVTALLEPLAERAASVVPVDWRPDLVVPVPLAGGRQRRRGFNQAAIIGRTVARELGATYGEPLRRRRDRTPQAALTAARRARNLDRVFAVPRPELVVGRRVLVVDDVTTTGTTLSVTSEVVRRAGAEVVFALALARED